MNDVERLKITVVELLRLERPGHEADDFKWADRLLTEDGVTPSSVRLTVWCLRHEAHRECFAMELQTPIRCEGGDDTARILVLNKLVTETLTRLSAKAPR